MTVLERTLTLAASVSATAAAYLLAVAAGAISAVDAERLVLTVGAIGAAIVAIGAAIRVLAALPPVRWLWRVVVARGWQKLVAEPLADWFEHVLDRWAATRIDPRLDALEAQHERNGGCSTRDRIEAIAEATGARPEPPRNVHPF